ncbi:MAG: DUF4407 domain-containing protein [Bacteroidales bacterium]|nr:DUF4407 domain-containing protein [Bacteroidales bacterium]
MEEFLADAAVPLDELEKRYGKIRPGDLVRVRFEPKDIAGLTLTKQTVEPHLVTSGIEPDRFDIMRQEGRRRREKDNDGKLREALLWVAGADRDMLKMAPRQTGSFVAQGMVMILVALIAAGSLGFALSYIGLHGVWWVAGAIACLVWFATVLSIDRLFTLHVHGDKWYKRLFHHGNWLRLVLSFFIGVVIATPLEMYIFRSDIDIAIDSTRPHLIEEYKKQNNDTYQKFDSINKESINDNNLEGIRKQNTQIEENDNTTIKEISKQLDKDSTISGAEKVKILEKNRKYRDKAIREREAKDSQRRSENNEIRNNMKNDILKLDSLASRYADKKIQTDKASFGKRLEALKDIKLRQTPDEISESTWWPPHAAVWVAVLLILVDMLPILLKCLTPGGEYEEWQRLEAEAKKSAKDSDVPEDVTILSDKLRERQLMAIEEVYTHAIDKWKAGMLDMM